MLRNFETAPLLTVKNLSFAYRHRRLIDGLGFSLRSGELLHIVGPNGAGKSTLLAILAGLLRPDTGSIDFVRADAESDQDADRRNYLEFLPAEANALYFKMDATQNLRFWAHLRGVSLNESQVKTALGRWQLDHPLLRQGFPVEKFSTGMKRRLALARLEISPAPCWLLDEPVYGLDAAATATFTQMVARHLAQGGSGLVVSHETKPIENLVTSKLVLGDV